jgi:hypothetical protein
MNKELKKGVKTLLSKLESTEKFVLDQAPELCKQIVEEKIMEEKLDAFFYGAGSFILLSLAILFGAMVYFATPREYGPSDKQMVCGLISVIAGLGLVPTFSVFYGSLRNAILVKKYPKVYLVNQLRSILK